MTPFFLLFHRFRNHFFFPIFGNAIATIAKKNIYSPISAMALPQLGSHKKFFSPYFGNGIATISLPQFFFLPISAMALPQLVCHKFFFSYFGNAIATNPFHFFFLETIHAHNFYNKF